MAIRVLCVALIALTLAAATFPTDPSGSCGTKPIPVDCENTDFGTCGDPVGVFAIHLRQAPRAAN